MNSSANCRHQIFPLLLFLFIILLISHFRPTVGCCCCCDCCCCCCDCCCCCCNNNNQLGVAVNGTVIPATGTGSGCEFFFLLTWTIHIHIKGGCGCGNNNDILNQLLNTLTLGTGRRRRRRRQSPISSSFLSNMQNNQEKMKSRCEQCRWNSGKEKGNERNSNRIPTMDIGKTRWTRIESSRTALTTKMGRLTKIRGKKKLLSGWIR